MIDLGLGVAAKVMIGQTINCVKQLINGSSMRPSCGLWTNVPKLRISQIVSQKGVGRGVYTLGAPRGDI